MAGVVARVPSEVCGRPVTCLVVDDGSSDDTVARAVAAGAEVVGLRRHTGLGAAVRRGLEEGVRRGAVAIAFCDADGEYAPEELHRLVGPVLDGTADYVVGSRFAGSPRRMAPHRWLGNQLLTVVLGVLAGRKVSDGQSGYRALSLTAAAEAEIAHDYNYAQVLTLDLMTKGFRYREVPISYRFRTTGRSFVRPARYLREVAPTVLRLRLARTPARGGETGRRTEPVYSSGQAQTESAMVSSQIGCLSAPGGVASSTADARHLSRMDCAGLHSGGKPAVSRSVVTSLTDGSSTRTSTSTPSAGAAGA